ncbi:glycosyltransferase family 2 protein [Brachyspira intermedia]|uniref:glycosyltransferase family 2 protein n=1 Tax=Brachyspira intermedia TaxID=84377 RepID=UPI003005AFB0
MINVSIIIPVYNVEKYLEKCLDSIINQTLKNIEIICIDDCSTDNSLSILEKYKLKDNRIVLIKNKVNLGKGDIRNLGINNSHGEYIGFVDSDDTIDERYFEELYNTAKEYDSDIVCTNNIKVVNSNFIKHDKINYSQFKSGILNYDASIFIESMRNHFIIKYSINRAIWNKLWKKSFLLDNKIKFLMNFIGQDFCFVLTSLVHSPKISYNDKAVYYYFFISQKNIPVEYLESYMLIAKHTIKYTRENNIKYLNNIFNTTMGWVYYSLTDVYKHYDDKNYVLKILFDFLDELSFEDIDNANNYLKSFFLKIKNNKDSKIIDKRILLDKFITKLLPPFALKYLRTKNMIC